MVPVRVSRSLLVLMLLWLTLCAGLVVKHRELVSVFFSFCGSFALAAFLNTRIRLSASKYKGISKSRHRQTKSLVGLVACSVALWKLSSNNSSEYAALSIVTGYLAFEPFFSTQFCQPPSKPLLSVTEDAVTLTVILILLVTIGDQLETQRSSICAWMVYKTIRLTLDVQVVEEPRSKRSPISPRPQSLSEKVTAKSPAPHWIIHGVSYNLTDFVERHPGGVEAILLAQDRDCTALFESYHPFTDRHKIVLSKYRHEQPATVDPFYQVLCQRVAKTLRDKGIDPIADRTASPLRSFYYLVIACCLVTSGVAHCKVRYFFFAYVRNVNALAHNRSLSLIF
jgi:cytochrome b involved in lipid metabolism